MSDSEKKLEKRVREAGENLLDQPPPSSIRRLLELHDLDEVFCCLSEVEQNPPISMKNALSPSIKALAATELFEHSDRDVKVAVTACISQIMRITAPYAPYDDDKMKEVLQLIVSSFEHLSDMCSYSYPKRILILETVSQFNFVALMLHLECYALVVEMFHHFFKVIRDHHSNEVFLGMENIMTRALEERDDIHPEMLSPILHYVKKDHKIPQVSQRLAERVLSRCASKLKTRLTEAVKASGVSLDKYSDVVASICEGTFSALKEISTQKAKPSATTSATKAISEAKLTKKSGKTPDGAKHTVPAPTKKKTSEKKAIEMIWCKKPRSQRRKKKSQDLGKPQMRSRHQLLQGDNKKVSDLQNYDENLLGSTIRIWWPLDHAYYKGVVNSYDSSKRRHLVCYEDGDQEILNLINEKWYLVTESEFSEDPEANQTGRNKEACTMPPKKKAKTDKAQSANKQSEMLSPIPPYVKKVLQVSQRFAEQVLNSCGSQLKTHLTEAVKSSSVSMDKNSNVVDSICNGEITAVEQEKVVANGKEDRQGTREMAVKDNHKAQEVSTLEQPCVHAAISSINKNGHEAVSPRCETVAGVKTQKRAHEMVQLPVAEEEDPVEAETQTHKRARGESCSLHEVHNEVETTIAAEGEHSCSNLKSNAEAEHKKVPQPCSISDQLAKVKRSIVDTINSVRQFRSELETKEQSIVDTLTSVRQFRSEIKEKEDNLEASLQEVDVLGEKIMGINKILNS